MPKKVLEGIVVSSKANKSITVVVERKFQHPVLQKVVKTKKKYHAHDENNESQTGDLVTIQECRPLSKSKSWKLVNVIEKNKALD